MKPTEKPAEKFRSFTATMRAALEQIIATPPEAFHREAMRPEFAQHVAQLEALVEGLRRARERLVDAEEEVVALRELVDVGESFERVATHIFEARGDL